MSIGCGKPQKDGPQPLNICCPTDATKRLVGWAELSQGNLDCWPCVTSLQTHGAMKHQAAVISGEAAIYQ